MESGEWGVGSRGNEGKELIINAPCPI